MQQHKVEKQVQQLAIVSRAVISAQSLLLQIPGLFRQMSSQLEVAQCSDYMVGTVSILSNP